MDAPPFRFAWRGFGSTAPSGAPCHHPITPATALEQKTVTCGPVRGAVGLSRPRPTNGARGRTPYSWAGSFSCLRRPETLPHTRSPNRRYPGPRSLERFRSTAPSGAPCHHPTTPATSPLADIAPTQTGTAPGHTPSSAVEQKTVSLRPRPGRRRGLKTRKLRTPIRRQVASAACSAPKLCHTRNSYNHPGSAVRTSRLRRQNRRLAPTILSGLRTPVAFRCPLAHKER